MGKGLANSRRRVAPAREGTPAGVTAGKGKEGAKGKPGTATEVAKGEAEGTEKQEVPCRSDAQKGRPPQGRPEVHFLGAGTVGNGEKRLR